MTTTAHDRLEALADAMNATGQSHLLEHARGLTGEVLEGFVEQLEAIEFGRVPEWVAKYVTAAPELSVDVSAIQPPRMYTLDGDWDREGYRSKGEALLREGKVAAFTVAGGQGSRLGYDGPKGCYPGGAVSRKPLFACLADWISSAQSRYGAVVPWYIMTSPLNHERTVAFFAEHDHFGLDAKDIRFFPQGVMPSFDMRTGKILLAGEGVIATNPDGHGGSLRALETSGALKDMQERGITQISYVQIDNPLARALDPVFLGLHTGAPDSSGEISTKVVSKRDAGERVGVLCEVGGKTQVIEYSDLPEDLASAREAGGALRIRAGNIAIHAMSVEFVARLNRGDALALPFHRAVKKVPYFDPAVGGVVEPGEPNAVKLEMFVFDALPMAGEASSGGSIVYEVERTDEFAPIKNAEGDDSPASSTRLQTERAAKWLAAHNIEIPRHPDGAPNCTLEVSPLTAWHAKDPGFTPPTKIEPGQSLAL